MKPLMQNRYVGWMAVRPLLFGEDYYEPGDRVPQKVIEGMRDPEVLVRTGRLAAVAKDMNKVPRYLRKDVTDAEEMLAKILAPRISTQIGDVVPRALMDQYADLVDEVDDDPTVGQEDVTITDTDDAATIAQIAPELQQPEVEDHDAAAQTLEPGTELTRGEDGLLYGPDGQLYTGAVTEGDSEPVVPKEPEETRPEPAPVEETEDTSKKTEES